MSDIEDLVTLLAVDAAEEIATLRHKVRTLTTQVADLEAENDDLSDDTSTLGGELRLLRKEREVIFLKLRDSLRILDDSSLSSVERKIIVRALLTGVVGK